MELNKKKSDRQFIKTGEPTDKRVSARKTPKPKFPNLQLLFAWELIRDTPLTFTEISNLTRCYFDLHGSPEGIPLKRLKGFFEGKHQFTPLEFFVLTTSYGFNAPKPAPRYERLWPHERPFKMVLTPIPKPAKRNKKMLASVA